MRWAHILAASLGALVFVGCSLLTDLDGLSDRVGLDDASVGIDPRLDATAIDADADADADAPRRAVTLIGATNAGPIDADSISVNTPLGVTVGDVLLVGLFANNGSTATTPPGWGLLATLSFGTSSGGGTGTSYWRAVAAGEPATHTFSLSKLERTAIAVAAYRGAATPITATAFVASPNGSSIAAPSFIAPSEASRLVGVFVADVPSSQVWTAPSGMKEVTILPQVAIFEELLPRSGPTGSRTATISIATEGAGGLIVLAPAP